jgi:asparagine synthase (glutamine-hydrolysing)
MYHRGPDDSGIWIDTTDTPVTLVNTRLAIIDLSEAGHMPMLSHNSEVAITYNGEVYNFPEIRSDLEKLGYTFVSNSDTEVILSAYQHWGDACVERFRGMFAFLIWDVRKQRLFAARDRLGIKPLYWSMVGEDLILGSELKTILASGLIEPVMNYQALHHYLTFYAVPPPLTMLENIHSLLPGHCLIWEKGTVSVKQYWDLPVMTSNDDKYTKYDEIETKLELRRLLEESIKLRMVSDVPVGAFLSGGVDSSAVVALMARLTGERLKTFSVGYDIAGKSMDERHYAELVARRYDTDHNEVIISGREVAAQLSNFVCAMDQPTGDGLNTYLVSRATSDHVKVALSGLGGDELFAGYRQYRYLMNADIISKVWNDAPKLAQSLGRTFFAGLAGLSGRPALAEVPEWLESSFLHRYLRTRTLFNEESKAALYRSGMSERYSMNGASVDLLTPYLNCREHDPIMKVTRLELKSYMSHMLLRDTDVTSMAHSLEVRVPLIDHKLVEFAANIPAAMKLGNSHVGKFVGPTKVVLTDALVDVLPKQILGRKKQGFFMPVGSWMLNDLEPVVSEALSSDTVSRRGIFDPSVVSGLRSDFENGTGSYMKVWALLMLELWQREFID